MGSQSIEPALVCDVDHRSIEDLRPAFCNRAPDQPTVAPSGDHFDDHFIDQVRIESMRSIEQQSNHQQLYDQIDLDRLRSGDRWFIRRFLDPRLKPSNLDRKSTRLN